MIALIAATHILFIGAANVMLSAPQTLAEFDATKLKGDLMRLAWSDDGTEFYVQTVERDKSGIIKAAHHYIVSAASKSLKDTDAEPAWAVKYWTWKAGQASPADAFMRIDVKEHTETKRAASAPTGGALARGGTVDPGAGTTLGDVAAAADASQTLKVFSLKVKDETIGEWTNEAVVPGINFTWAPAPLRMIAFARRGGGPIVVLDGSGQKYHLAGVDAALVPAWSGNGKRIAWLEKKDRKKMQLMVADISVQ